MPFPLQPLHIYNRANVLALEPNQMGVYGLFRQEAWIYVGKGDIRKRLIDHLNEDNPCITKGQPTHWVYEVTANMDEREWQLIFELEPLCNQRVR
jgi:hypothetical protein